MSERIKMTVEMEVTEPQALALQAMFKYWNYLGNVGGSREVTFYVDGDGNFKPRCSISFDNDILELTKEMEQISVVKDSGGNRTYDFDRLGWKLRDLKDKEIENGFK